MLAGVTNRQTVVTKVAASEAFSATIPAPRDRQVRSTPFTGKGPMVPEPATGTSFPYSIAPWLSVPNGGRAVDFYKSAFGATEAYRMDMPGGGLVARLSVQGAEFEELKGQTLRGAQRTDTAVVAQRWYRGLRLGSSAAMHVLAAFPCGFVSLRLCPCGLPKSKGALVAGGPDPAVRRLPARSRLFAARLPS